MCGVCGGDNSQCAGCDGEPLSGVQWDSCGVCGGSNDCLDCAGVVNGSHLVDKCGNCLLPAFTCSDGPLSGLPCISNEGCAGSICSTQWPLMPSAASGSEEDSSTTWNSCVDCAGVVDGPAVRDSCGICDGQDASCVRGYSVYLAPPGGQVCVGDELRVQWRAPQPPPGGRLRQVVMGYRRLSSASAISDNSSSSGSAVSAGGLLAGWAYIDPAVACWGQDAAAPAANGEGGGETAATFVNQDDVRQVLGQSRWIDLRY